jgi:hypothetical protein
MEHVQQLSDRSHGQRNRAQVIWVEFEIGGGDRHVAFHVAMNPNHATAAEIWLVCDADER